MLALVRALKAPGLLCAPNRQGRLSHAVHSQLYSARTGRRVVYGVLNGHLVVLLRLVIPHSTADNGCGLALGHPHNILLDDIGLNGLSIDLRRHADFQQVAAVLLHRDGIGHLSTSHTGSRATNRLAVQCKIDLLLNAAIRCIAHCDLAAVEKAVIKGGFQIEINDIGTPLF